MWRMCGYKWDILQAFESYLRVMPEQVILVDENDAERGVMEKMEAHERGELHRAFSVFIFNSAGEMLLQRRAEEKYHSGGLLTNACCSHPRPGEPVEAAAVRRLREEMGLNADLRKKGTFIYKVGFENGLTEHELDHVFEGVTDGIPEPASGEVSEYRWMTVEAIKKMISAQPEQFTAWFRIAMQKLY